MRAISAFKRKGVASMYQIVPRHNLSNMNMFNVCWKMINKVYVIVCSRAKRLFINSR